MKRFFLLLFILVISGVLNGQRFITTTTNFNDAQLKLKHYGKFILGEEYVDMYSDDAFQIYNSSSSANLSFLLGTGAGRLQFSVSGCNGCYTSYSEPGDGIIRKIGNSHNILLHMTNSSNDGSSKISLGDEYGPVLTAYNNDKVTIGRGYGYDHEDFTLYVGKGIRTERIKVDIASENGWADFVFSEDYKLMSLSDLETFINENNHLPDIPSEEEVLSNGIDVSNMFKLLLQKIEELTLYTIDQEEKIEDLRMQIKLLNYEK